MTAKSMDTDHPLLTGAIGIFAAIGAFGVSLVSQVEQWLRIGSLTIGIVVGIISLRKLLKEK